MRIRSLFLYILFLSFFSFLFIQIVSAENVGMIIRKNGALLNEENLYWAYAQDTSSSPSHPSSSLMKLQVLADDGLKDRFRVDVDGNIKTSGQVSSKAFCLAGVAPAPPICYYDWSGLSGFWNEKGDSEIFFVGHNVGIGTADPKYTLDVFGEIGVNDVQTVYVPNQTTFESSLVFGNGGANLSHSVGDEGHHNTFIGMVTGRANTIGHRNTFIGSICGDKNTTGNQNTFIGMYVGELNTTGNRNTFVGTQTGGVNIDGSYNVYMGWGSGQMGTSSSHNVMMGYGTGYFNESGSYNVLLGHDAGNVATTSDNLFINNSGGDTPLIRGDFLLDELYFNGNVGIGDLSPNAKLSVNGGIKIGDTNICEDGVLRFNDVIGEFEYCYAGVWAELDGE